MDSKIYQEARPQRRVAALRSRDKRRAKHLSHKSDRGNRVDPKAALAQPVSLTQPELTLREREVLVGIACGAPDEEIAKLLNVSPTEVEAQIEIICKKLNAPNRLQAVLWAAEYL
jgi:DNA-binding NarL/FixJ family response regulator